MGKKPASSCWINAKGSSPRNIWVPRMTGTNIVVTFSGFNDAHSSCPGMRRFNAGESLGHSFTQRPHSIQFWLECNEKGPWYNGQPRLWVSPLKQLLSLQVVLQILLFD